MNKHSPGPWRASYGGKWGWVSDANGRCVTVDALAEDTALIAAAPEMLELLRGAGDWYCGELSDGTDRRKAIAALLKRIGAP